MTTRTRRALVRVQHAARRLIEAVDALGPRDLAELSMGARISLGAIEGAVSFAERHFTAAIGPEPPAPLTERERFAASRDPEDALMEARDVAAELAADRED